MSIGKRLIDLVRSNVNFVLEKATPSDHGARKALEDLSDEELEREMRRRRQRRDAAERAADSPSSEQDAWDEVEEAVRGGGRFRSSGRRAGSYQRTSTSTSTGYGAGARHRSTGARDPRLAQFYAQLECPYGADLTTVRKHYRAMMRKYHPDMHSRSPDKQRIATELSQRLTLAYNELRRALS